MNGIDIKINAKADFDPVIREGSGVVASLNKGVAKMASALLGPWIAERERNARLIAEQTAVECRALQEKRVSYVGGRLIPYQPPAHLAEAYQQLHVLNHEADALRLKAAMDVAATKFYEIPDADVSDEPLSQTFFNHWRREAETIDEADIRERWSQLLVREVKRPGTVSIRTLDVVARMTRDEAAVFEKARQGAFGGLLLLGKNDEDSLFCTYGECLILADAGLITLPDVSWKANPNDKGFCERRFPSENVMMRVNQKSYSVGGYALTRAGKELVGSLETPRPLKVLRVVLERVAEQNRSAKITLHRIVQMLPNGHWKYETQPFETFGPMGEVGK